MRFALILSLLIAIAAVVFALYNPDPVSVNLIQYQVTSPLAVVVIVMLLAGVLIGVLASVPGMIRRGAHTRRLEKRVTELERGEPRVTETRVTERVVERPADAGAPAATAGGAAETQRLAAETQRMAAEAQLRAAEAERLEAERRGGPPAV